MSGARLALTLCVTKAREGSEEDLAALKRMFHQLKFESTVKKDPTAEVRCCRPQASVGGGWATTWTLGPLLRLAVPLAAAIPGRTG